MLLTQIRFFSAATSSLKYKKMQGLHLLSPFLSKRAIVDLWFGIMISAKLSHHSFVSLSSENGGTSLMSQKM